MYFGNTHVSCCSPIKIIIVIFPITKHAVKLNSNGSRALTTPPHLSKRLLHLPEVIGLTFPGRHLAILFTGYN